MRVTFWQKKNELGATFISKKCVCLPQKRIKSAKFHIKMQFQPYFKNFVDDAGLIITSGGLRVWEHCIRGVFWRFFCPMLQFNHVLQSITQTSYSICMYLYPEALDPTIRRSFKEVVLIENMDGWRLLIICDNWIQLQKQNRKVHF